MNRIVNDNPQTNTEVLFNLAYVKDKEVWIRGGGPDGEDCTLIDLCKDACEYNEICPAPIQKADIETIGDLYMDCSMHGCKIGLMYFLGVQAAELRERVREYEEKDTPKQPVKDKAHPRYGMGYEYCDWMCPSCEMFLAFEPAFEKIPERCPKCNQRLTHLTRKDAEAL